MKRNRMNVRMKTILCLAGWMIGILAVSCNKKKTAGAPACCQKENVTAKADASRPDGSLYQLTGSWTDQRHENMELKRLRGKWQLAAMIFTNCGYACPRIVENMQAIENQLPPEIKRNVGFLLVSFDTQKDTPDRLQAYAGTHGLDSSWTLLHGEAGQVRTLSMMLDVKYDLLPNGSFNHSNVITLLDEEGAVVKRFEGLDIDVKAAARDIAALARP